MANSSKVEASIFSNLASLSFNKKVRMLFLICAAIFSIVNWYEENKPIPMSGDWNIAISAFTTEPKLGIRESDALDISRQFYTSFSDNLDSLPSSPTFQIYGPDDIPIITGGTALERAENARRLAIRYGVDLLIYGHFDSSEGGIFLNLEFYLASANSFDLNDLLGPYSNGGKVPIIGSIQTGFPSQLNLNRLFISSSTRLALVSQAFSKYLFSDYQHAYELLQEANSADLWPTNDGREFLFLFLGNSALKSQNYDAAESYYHQALEVNPDYGRALIGLASLKYARAVHNTQGELDALLLKEAETLYRKAQQTIDKADPSNLSVKISFGFGQVYFAYGSLLDPKYLGPATSFFQDVIKAYNEAKDPEIRDLAAESYDRIGLILIQGNQLNDSIHYLSQASSLALAPSRKGLFLSTLADVFYKLGMNDEAKSTNENAVTQYLNAIALTDSNELNAQFYAGIAACYEREGLTEKAIEYYQRALALLPEESIEIARYQQLIDKLLNSTNGNQND